MLTWSGLELKSEINFFMMMVEKATKFKVDKKIPAKFFEIPKGFTYTATDVYQGFSGLELSFDTLSELNSESKTGIKVEFNSSSLGGTDNFKYFNASGKELSLEGVNSYNKVDQLLIKSQQNQLVATSVELSKYQTTIYQTTGGDYGKMQLVSVEEGSYLIRYALFNNNGFIKEYSDGSSSFLTEDFEIIINENTNKLELVPKQKAKCFVLGEF